MKSTRPSASRSPEDRAVEAADVGALLTALEDPDCRAILRAVADDTYSATELSEACDLPLSTTYRKVEMLDDASLLAEQIRVCSSGKHTSEYTLCVESVHLSLAGDGIDVRVCGSTDSERCENLPQGVAGAD